MRHIDEIQIAGTAILLCGAMFAVSAVAPTGNTVSKAVTNFTEAPETAAEAQAQAEANSKLSSSITDELIRMKEAEARVEHGWVEIQGVNTVVK